MKIEDIEVGETYAIRYGPSEEWASAQVQVLSLDPENDRLDERSGGGRSVSGRSGTYLTGRRIRAVRVSVVKGHYSPFRAYGAEDIVEGAEGLIPPQHFWRTWDEHMTRKRASDERRDEATAAREFAKARAAEMTESVRALGLGDTSKIKVPPTFDGELLVSIKTLDELIARAARL